MTRDVDAMGNELGKLFLGGLPQSATEYEVKKYFSQYGEVDDVSIMMDNRTGRSRGFAYLRFMEHASVDKAINDRPHILDDKEIDVKQCNIHFKGKNRKSLKIFVGGIGPCVTKERLYSYFCQFGEISDLNLMMNTTHTKHRGFAFITFKDESVVRYLINKRHLQLDSKQIEVKAIEPINSPKPVGLEPGQHFEQLNTQCLIPQYVGDSSAFGIPMYQPHLNATFCQPWTTNGFTSVVMPQDGMTYQQPMFYPMGGNQPIQTMWTPTVMTPYVTAPCYPSTQQAIPGTVAIENEENGYHKTLENNSGDTNKRIIDENCPVDYAANQVTTNGTEYVMNANTPDVKYGQPQEMHIHQQRDAQHVLQLNYPPVTQAAPLIPEDSINAATSTAPYFHYNNNWIYSYKDPNITTPDVPSQPQNEGASGDFVETSLLLNNESLTLKEIIPRN